MYMLHKMSWSIDFVVEKEWGLFLIFDENYIIGARMFCLQMHIQYAFLPFQTKH